MKISKKQNADQWEDLEKKMIARMKTQNKDLWIDKIKNQINYAKKIDLIYKGNSNSIIQGKIKGIENIKKIIGLIIPHNSEVTYNIIDKYYIDNIVIKSDPYKFLDSEIKNALPPFKITLKLISQYLEDFDVFFETDYLHDTELKAKAVNEKIILDFWDENKKIISCENYQILINNKKIKLED